MQCQEEAYQFVSLVSHGSVEVTRASEVEKSEVELAIGDNIDIQPPILKQTMIVIDFTCILILSLPPSLPDTNTHTHKPFFLLPVCRHPGTLTVPLGHCELRGHLSRSLPPCPSPGAV